MRTPTVVCSRVFHGASRWWCIRFYIVPPSTVPPWDCHGAFVAFPRCFQPRSWYFHCGVCAPMVLPSMMRPWGFHGAFVVVHALPWCFHGAPMAVYICASLVLSWTPLVLSWWWWCVRLRGVSIGLSWCCHGACAFMWRSMRFFGAPIVVSWCFRGGASFRDASVVL